MNVEQQANLLLLTLASFFATKNRWFQQGVYLDPGEEPESSRFCAHGALAYFASHELRQRLKRGENPYLTALLVEEVLDQHPIATVARDKLCAVGLTIGYNDLSSTRKEDIVTKIRQAVNDHSPNYTRLPEEIICLRGGDSAQNLYQSIG